LVNAKFVATLRETGLAAEAYQEVMEQQAALDPADFEGLEAERVAFARLNLHRTDRIRRNWRPSGDLAALVAAIDTPQMWLILTEPWCGDSAQCLPCLEILAAANPHLTVRFLLRDVNPDTMDQYLTGGKRSIPILVALDDDGSELYRWGPRPAAAQEVFDAATAEGLEKPAKLEKLHLFYGRDRGRALGAEMQTLLAAYLDGRL
jgi:hypothetical protein